MARIRTVKPEMWTDPAFVECSSNARLLFVAALNFASDYGVLEASASRLKMQCFPADNFDVAPLIEELVAASLWVRMIAPDGANVLVVRTFCDHQRVDRIQEGRWGDWRKWPLKAVDSSNDRRTIVERSTCNGREGNGSNNLIAKAIDADFETFYNAYPRHVGRLSAEKAYRAARKRTDAPTILVALTAYVRTVKGKEKDFIAHPASWLNGGRWMDETTTEADGAHRNTGRVGEGPGGRWYRTEADGSQTEVAAP